MSKIQNAPSLPFSGYANTHNVPTNLQSLSTVDIHLEELHSLCSQPAESREVSRILLRVTQLAHTFPVPPDGFLTTLGDSSARNNFLDGFVSPLRNNLDAILSAVSLPMHREHAAQLERDVRLINAFLNGLGVSGQYVFVSSQNRDKDTVSVQISWR